MAVIRLRDSYDQVPDFSVTEMEQGGSAPLRIETAGFSDLRAAIDIEHDRSRKVYVDTARGITQQDIDDLGWGEGRINEYERRYLENPNARMFVAREGDRIVGYAAVMLKNDGAYYVDKLYTAESGKGWGTHLLSTAERFLHEVFGASKAYVVVTENNQEALDFYLGRDYGYVCDIRPGTDPEHYGLAAKLAFPKKLLVKSLV